MKKLNARLLAYRTPTSNIKAEDYKLVSLEEMCEKAGVKKRITSDRLPNYYYSLNTDNNYVHPTGKYAGAKSLADLPEKEFNLRLLEIFAYAFLDYPVRECICSRGFFQTPFITEPELLKTNTY